MKPTLKKIDGILLLNKPLEMTSNGALQRIKRLFGAKKAGHTGSLDPLATGMLPICFGEATKVSQFLLDSDKRYHIKVKLGMKTTTGDAEGEVIATRPVLHMNREKIQIVLDQFLGLISQIPPMFSAIKHQGKPLYELARQGLEVERKPREVFIYSSQLVSFEDETFVFDVHCSKGTYIRTLVEDIGEVLGCGAYVAGLHRTSVTPYQQNKMFGLNELETLLQQSGFDALAKCLLPVDTSVQHLPAVQLSTSAVFYMRTGQAVRVLYAPDAGFVRIFGNDGQFMGIGEILEDGRVAPRRLIIPCVSVI
ncbi:MAG TPA: tRNA pseudouridine(55) synthase TruB [Gammaproteobacteria bacterium]|nr:tRNA pseudouridine(55) synthase TruB [Gammaproteobacteria bacterium]